MRGCVFVLLVSACAPHEGAECTWEEHSETYGYSCSAGRLLHCEGDLWVDVGTEVGPDYSDPNVLGGPVCLCKSPNRVECTYEDY